MLDKVTVTLVTEPVTPETVIVDGYGLPGPLSGVVIGFGFKNVFVILDIAPSRKVFVTMPRLLGPSCSWRTAVSMAAQLPLAVKGKGLLVAGPPAVKAP